MYVNFTSTRVRYAETDQMGVVYYGTYPQYFEIGRVEALRSLGITYKKMEEEGIMLPVLKLEIKYIRPATYDMKLNIKTFLTELPTSRICFHHEIFDENDQLLTTGSVALAFVDAHSRRPCRPPAYVVEKLKTSFNA